MKIFAKQNFQNKHYLYIIKILIVFVNFSKICNNKPVKMMTHSKICIRIKHLKLREYSNF